MSIANVFSFRVRPGRQREFLALAESAKEIVTRLGARMRVFVTAVGSEPGAVSCVLELGDMTAYAEFIGKLRSDSDWQAFYAKMQGEPNPTAELVSTSLLRES